MTKQQKAKALIEAVYQVTQKGKNCIFSGDFEGMMRVTVGDRHTHVGVPGGSLEKMIVQATQFINTEAGES